MIVQLEGLWWPEADTKGRKAILRDRDRDIALQLAHVKGRDCIVQAGGNVGVYALALADHFKRVVTVEPDPENYSCLVKNLTARDSLNRVDARKAAFGETAGTCRMVAVEADNCGAHRIDHGGSIPLITIDSLSLTKCDALWLDLEGSELSALKGAVGTIEAFSPVITIEDKGLDKAFGAKRGEAVNWLGLFGYQQVDQLGRDKIFRRSK